MGLRACFVAVAAFALTSCNFLFKLRSDKVLVMTWLDAPVIDVEPFRSSPELNMRTATAFFAKGGFEPVPVSGAFTSFFGRGQQVVMTEKNPELAPGIYTATSLENEKLVYDPDPNRRFGLRACVDNVEGEGCVGEEFTITRIRAAPALEPGMIVFEPPLQTPTLDIFSGAVDPGVDLTVVFPEPTDEFQYHPIVTVLGPTNESPVGMVFNSLPLQGPEIVKFITEAPPLRITIPADKLTQQGLYLVLAATARLNLDSSDNVLIGAAIAGALTGFVIEVKGTLQLPAGFQLPVNLPGGIPNIPGIPTSIPTEIPAGIPGFP